MPPRTPRTPRTPPLPADQFDPDGDTEEGTANAGSADEDSRDLDPDPPSIGDAITNAATVHVAITTIAVVVAIALSQVQPQPRPACRRCHHHIHATIPASSAHAVRPARLLQGVASFRLRSVCGVLSLLVKGVAAETVAARASTSPPAMDLACLPCAIVIILSSVAIVWWCLRHRLNPARPSGSAAIAPATSTAAPFKPAVAVATPSVAVPAGSAAAAALTAATGSDVGSAAPVFRVWDDVFALFAPSPPPSPANQSECDIPAHDIPDEGVSKMPKREVVEALKRRNVPHTTTSRVDVLRKQLADWLKEYDPSFDEDPGGSDDEPPDSPLGRGIPLPDGKVQLPRTNGEWNEYFNQKAAQHQEQLQQREEEGGASGNTTEKQYERAKSKWWGAFCNNEEITVEDSLVFVDATGQVTDDAKLRMRQVRPHPLRLRLRLPSPPPSSRRPDPPL